jgi:hypothetical protein
VTEGEAAPAAIVGAPNRNLAVRIVAALVLAPAAIASGTSTTADAIRVTRLR